ncbi:MAG: hypothetical protein Q8K57_10755 [Thiobacillus sp.]|nr:hypothetical protein [Thiobacillus sp.]
MAGVKRLGLLSGRLLEQRVGDGGLITDGWLECGTCRIVCDEFNNVEWDYHRVGFGILYKFR